MLLPGSSTILLGNVKGVQPKENTMTTIALVMRAIQLQMQVRVGQPVATQMVDIVLAALVPPTGALAGQAATYGSGTARYSLISRRPQLRLGS
jgi:hypothetical protein